MALSYPFGEKLLRNSNNDNSNDVTVDDEEEPLASLLFPGICQDMNKVSRSSSITIGIQQMLVCLESPNYNHCWIKYGSYLLPCSVLQSSFRQEMSEVMPCSMCKRKLRLQNDTLLRLHHHLPGYHLLVKMVSFFAGILILTFYKLFLMR